ncbi:hypothetical protein [Terribacillus saccharophilus]|uniref:hypothetical protein n=1 Tax=Terribacillus saccharophilus TaxID=361277 RepID=UPI0039824427
MNIIDVIGAYVTISALLSPLIVFLIKKYIEAKVKHGFDKGLEDHKHDLQLLTKEVEYDYQRRIHDFSLFSSKKHEVYPQLYSLISDLHMKFEIASSAYKEYPDFRTDTKFDRIEEYLKKHEVSDDSIEQVKTEWLFDKQKGIQKFQTSLDFQEILVTDKKRVEAYKEFLNKELFTGSELSDLIKEFLNDIRMVLVEETDKVLYGEYEGNRQEYYKKLRQKQEDIRGKKDKIKVMIQNELNIDNNKEMAKDTNSK